MNKHHITSFIIAGIVMTLPVNNCFAQTDEPKENNIRQIQILLRTEGLDVSSPERQGGVPALMKDQLLPPENMTQKEKSDMRRQIPQRQKEQAEGHKTSDPNHIREWLSQQIEALIHQGVDLQKQREHSERLQLALESSEREPADDIAVAVFAVPGEPQQRPEGSPKPTPPSPRPGERPMGDRPGFKPPMLMMQGHMLQHNGPGPQIHRLEVHRSEGPFANDKQRIAALTESAERLAQAGMPDVAHGLRERAGQIKKELAEKQKRIQHEERERAQAKMREQQDQARHQQERMAEQRRDSAERDDRPALPLRELQEQLEHLRREVHSIHEKVSRLTEMIEHHHRARELRGHHEEMEDDDEHEDEDDDTDEDRKVRQDRNRDQDEDDDREDD